MGREHTRPQPGAQSKRSAAIDWKPAVDIVEYADRFELLADLPGVNPADIDIQLHENTLSIAGHRRRDGNRTGQVHAERCDGYFCRRFTLPVRVDADEISARADHGALRLRVPKAAEIRPRRIDIAA